MPTISCNMIKCFFTLAVLLLMGSSCKKFIQVDVPDDQMTAKTVFANDSLAQAAVTGLYIKLMSNTKYLLNGGMSVFPALSADELVRTTPIANEDQFYSNNLLADNQIVLTNLWKSAYTYIYQCNICVEGLQKSTGVSASLNARLTGEVKFIRALCYFYLVNLYGDVPLALSTNADKNAVLPRTPFDAVYDQIVNDLLSATDLLTNDNSNTYPSQLAAQALLARVYLHRQQWDKAESFSTVVINSGKCSLQNNLASVFKSGSTETIFQLAPVLANINSVEGLIFIPASASSAPAYAIKTDLVSAFEPNDLRKTNWLNSSKVGSQTYYYPYKYKVRSSATLTEYNVILRLAEQYLIRAEARAHQNKVADAVSDLNTIRSRAGLPSLSSAISNDSCIVAVERERRTELFAEWGYRWFDLKRTNRADAILSAVKGGNWNTNDRLYPIPASEIETDPNLSQNPGY